MFYKDVKNAYNYYTRNHGESVTVEYCKNMDQKVSHCYVQFQRTKI